MCMWCVLQARPCLNWTISIYMHTSHTPMLELVARIREFYTDNFMLFFTALQDMYCMAQWRRRQRRQRRWQRQQQRSRSYKNNIHLDVHVSRIYLYYCVYLRPLCPYSNIRLRSAFRRDCVCVCVWLAGWLASRLLVKPPSLSVCGVRYSILADSSCLCSISFSHQPRQLASSLFFVPLPSSDSVCKHRAIPITIPKSNEMY